MPITLSSPLALYSIPIVWLTVFAPANLKVRTIRKTIGYDNTQPRKNVERMTSKQEIPPDLAARVARMEGAHTNGQEALPLWIAAILAGTQVGLDNRTLNIVSILFIGIRILYNYVYINQKTRLHGSMRTLIWCIGTSLPMYLLVKAANKYRGSGF